MMRGAGFVRPAVWGFYAVIVLEFLFMISPVALHFYSGYGPVLNVLHGSPWTAWLTSFFLPHFSRTTSPVLDLVKPAGFGLAAAGLVLFFVGAAQVYTAKLLRRGAVTGGFYRVVRHPQYLALTLLGFGITLIWARFLVLLSFVTMVFLYVMLARWEEDRCLEQFGESYRSYQQMTGMILPRWATGWWPTLGVSHGSWRRSHLLGTLASSLLIATVAAFALRSYSLAHVSASYVSDAAILSPAVLTAEELDEAFALARSDPDLRGRLDRQPRARLLAYVIPQGWFLPDLPLHSEAEIREVGGGHRSPSEFDRATFDVLVTRVRSHDPNARGADIVKKAFGRTPVLIVTVDLAGGTVLGTREPPDHVIWGDIPTPLF